MILHRFRLLYMAVFVVATFRTVAAEPFGSAESIRAWSFHNGPEFPGASGSVAWNNGEGHSQPGCLELKYSFSGGGHYVQAAVAVPDGAAPVMARVWLKKGSGHRVTFRGVDSAGQSFQKSIEYRWPGWQQVEIDLTRWDNGFGGPKDGQLRPPLKQFGILVENSQPEKEGSLLIDDLEFSAQPGPAARPVTYTVAQYAAPMPAVTTDVSLWGEPVSMKIVLDADGSGEPVRVELGSHFQSFAKEVGKLTERGEQIIDVPLGKLQGWEHFGGENNGVVRLPLRLRQISITPGSGAGQAVGFKRIEVSTLPRDGQFVVLVPDVRREDDRVRFTVKAIHLRGKPMKGRLRCDIRDLTHSLAREETEITLGADGAQAEWAVEQEMGEARFIEAVFRWSDDTFTSKPVSIGTCAMPSDAGSAALQPDSVMGAGLYLYRHRGNPNYRESIAQVCALAQQAGVKWTREEMQWSWTEREEGKFDWQFYDDVVDIARAHGISVYGLLAYWSGWAEVNTPKGVEQYCRWARQIVRHYKGRIQHWEIWNEPNIFFWSGPKELYADLLRQSYAAIKAEDPEAVVLGCSTAGIDTNFIKNVMKWGGKFDALTIHPYRGTMLDLDFIKELQDVRKLVDGREVWLTEIGFPSQLIDGHSERRQASLVARVYLCSAASGAARSVSWYDFRNDSDDPFYNEMNFGLVRHDLRPKPGYGTLASVARTLGHLRVAGSVDVGPNAYAFRFTDGRRDVVAVCAPEVSRLLSLNTAADAWSDAFEGRVVPGAIGDSQVITLTAGFPVFIHGPAGFALEAVANPVTYTVEPAALKPGDPFEFRISRGLEVGAITWELPQNWPSAERVSTEVWRMRVSPNAPAGEFDVLAVLRTRDGTTLELPARISVAPSIIRD